MKSINSFMVPLGALLFLLAAAGGPSRVCRAGDSQVPAQHLLPDRLLKYLEADPALRPALMLEDGDGLMPVTVTFFSMPDDAALSEMEDAGVRFYYSSKGILHYNLSYPARAEEAGLEFLDSAAGVRKVSPPPAQKPVPLLDWTRVDIGAEQAWYHSAEPWPLTGKGITIADLDTNMDVFHPMFYRPDGGYYAWVDVDGDGRLTIGTDGIDLDGDGSIAGGEVIRLIDAAAWRLYAWPPVTLPDASYDGAFTAGLDWLYLDVNGNGLRDYGYAPDDPVFPITEETPAYGEPIFVADDVDRDGVLDPDEKLVRLGTCKVKAILQGPGYVEYIRGENLVRYPVTGAWDMEHATQALGIVGGGAAGLTRFTGIAPDADLVLASYLNVDYMACLTWVMEQEPDIILHEAGSWVDCFLDGSSEEEVAIDEATRTDGVIQVNPAGNLGGSGKHAKVDVAAGETAEIGLNIPDAGGYYVLHAAIMSFLWRQAAADLRFEMCSVEGVCDDFTVTGNEGEMIWDGTMFVITWQDTSDRGTRKITAGFGDLVSYSDPLPMGDWRLRIVNPSAENVTVHLYLTDDLLDWTYGASWNDAATDLYTVTHPGTADTAINVAAYAGHGEDWGDPARRGEYRWYSSRGPRIDEEANMDVAAPDDPITPAPPIYGDMKWGSYLEFGGTSGAGPHVAGGTALILQADPTLTGDLMRTAVQEGALVDVDVTGAIPNDQWGYGKFRVYRTIFGEDPPDNEAPQLSLAAPEQVRAGAEAVVTPEASDPDGDEAAMVMRWDIDYDGTWDTDWLEVAPYGHVFDEPGRVSVKAEVRDEFGLTAQAAVSFEVTGVPEEEEPEPAEGTPDEALEPQHDGEEGDGPGPIEVSGGCGCVTSR